MKKTNTNTTELVFIIDRSGSMHGLEADTIGGFNSMLDKQKKEDGKAYVTTVLFDTDEKVLHDRMEFNSVNSMTDKDYCAGGCTALFDAVGNAIEHISSIHKYARSEDVPENTMFVIITDGMENASRKFSKRKVKELIEHKKKKYGWEFIFIGANIDAAETAEDFGIDRERAVNYIADSEGTQVVYEAVCENVSKVRKGVGMSRSWSASIERDYNRRKKGE